MQSSGPFVGFSYAGIVSSGGPNITGILTGVFSSNPTLAGVSLLAGANNSPWSSTISTQKNGGAAVMFPSGVYLTSVSATLDRSATPPPGQLVGYILTTVLTLSDGNQYTLTQTVPVGIAASGLPITSGIAASSGQCISKISLSYGAAGDLAVTGSMQTIPSAATPSPVVSTTGTLSPAPANSTLLYGGVGVVVVLLIVIILLLSRQKATIAPATAAATNSKATTADSKATNSS